MFDIIWTTSNWLYTDELLYLDKLFENHLFRKLFSMTLITQKKNIFLFHSKYVTQKLYFSVLWVNNLETLIFFFKVSNPEMLF